MTLELQNIRFGFNKVKPLLNDVSLFLEAGKVYVLMGSNGAGKTTLFNLITGFVKPQKGYIIFKQQVLNEKAPYKINRVGISRTFQDLRIITKLTVKENVILAMKDNLTDNWLKSLLPETCNRKANQILEKKAGEIIEQFFLKEVTHSNAGETSYGQQKLLTLACCVANGASFLLLDEPVAGIQPEYRNKIAILLKQLKAEGKTILLIEHNTDFIDEVADQIFFLHEGKLSTFNSLQSLKTNSLITEAYT